MVHRVEEAVVGEEVEVAEHQTVCAVQVPVEVALCEVLLLGCLSTGQEGVVELLPAL